MAHDVFLSYSSKDKTTADAACAVLEQKGIRCWMAPRDIRPGADWGEAIVDAIQGSRVFVLVFSRNANASPQIKREVERAINKGIPVIPFRIENVMPEKALEYFLSTPHWLDAFSPPLEQHLNYLAAVVGSVLDGQAAPAPLPQPAPAPALDRRLVLGGGIGLAALAGAGYFLFGRTPSFAGTWTAESIAFDAGTPSPFAPFSINKFLQAAITGGKLSGSLTVDEIGAFKYTWGGDDTGRLTAQGGNRISFESDVAHQATPFTYSLLQTPPPQLVSSLGGQPGQAAIILDSVGTGQSILVGASDGPGLAGHWYTNTPAMGPIDAIETALDVGADGHYHYRCRFTEAGTLEAKDGKWTRNRAGTLPVTGTYQFEGSSRVRTAGGGGVTVWVRSG